MRLILALTLFLTALAPARADEARDVGRGDFRPIPLHTVTQRVTDRYDGRLIGVRLQFATPQEMRMGAQLVYEMRLLTPQHHLLLIRMDARDGRFLDIAGAGQTEALK